MVHALTNLSTGGGKNIGQYFVNCKGEGGLAIPDTKKNMHTPLAVIALDLILQLIP